MRIIATGDWHLGNMFHGNDRLNEHKHFLNWLTGQIDDLNPDALLVAGDVFDNGNPSAASQSTYYEFLSEATEKHPGLQIVVTAGNHDSASRLEAPRPMLARHKVEVRGNVHRIWKSDDEDGHWEVDFDDLMIPIEGSDGSKAVVLALPYLRSDVLNGANYSDGVNEMMRRLTSEARAKHQGLPLVMMAHMYASGASIADKDASEKIAIGGLEQVTMPEGDDRPDYLTCGHIHKRQAIWNTDWARYTGSVLPMSFAEKDYEHGVDLIEIDSQGKVSASTLTYTPQRKLVLIPEEDKAMTKKQLEKEINQALEERDADTPVSESAKYVVLKVDLNKIGGLDALKELEQLVASKDAVLCKSQKIVEDLGVTTMVGDTKLESIDHVVNRDPMEALREVFALKKQKEMNERQEQMLAELVMKINTDNTDNN